MIVLVPAGVASAQSPAIPSPEIPVILQQVVGTIITTKPVGGITAVDLPSLRTRDLIPPVTGLRENWAKAIYEISGPDIQGQVAFVADGGDRSLTGFRGYEVHLLRADGKDEVLFTGPGDALWDHAISALALSPRGGRIAFITQPKENQDQRFRPLVNGPLQIWDVQSKSVRDLSITAVNQRPAWFPDGRRLLYVAPVPGSSPLPYLGPREGEPHLPVIHILDTETGVDSVLAKGHLPIVSSDGLSVLVERYRGRFVLIDVASGNEKGFPALGRQGHPVALIGSRYVILYGRPLPGEPTGQTGNNSPLVGPKALQTVRLVDLQSDASAVLIPLFDPRKGLSVFARAKP